MRLQGIYLPRLALHSTAGSHFDMGTLSGITILVCYTYVVPATGAVRNLLPAAAYDQLTGVGGAAQHLLAFKAHLPHLRAAGAARVLGMSTEAPPRQHQVTDELQLPFPLVSDSGLQLSNRVGLPRMHMQGHTVLKEAVLVLARSRVEHVFYPMYPPDESAVRVRQWLQHCS